jgi:hypothetical protein
MANDEHVALLKQGIVGVARRPWNAWRDEN